MKSSAPLPAGTKPVTRRTSWISFITGCLCLLTALGTASQGAPLFEPVQAFARGPAFPQAGLILASDGNFYGTSSFGGSGGRGTVFRMSPSGVLTILVNFNGGNGGVPVAAPVQASDGNFYGTTWDGGSNNLGTVFRMTPSGVLTTLVNFQGSDGHSPRAALIQGGDGNFYGTTAGGGSGLYGTVFRMTPGGGLTTLANFSGSNGSVPLAALVQGRDGNFYGTTSKGSRLQGLDGGTVFRLTSSGTLTTLVDFTGQNGETPKSPLIQASDGNFYGTTSAGGNASGVVFRMTPTGTLTPLAYFGLGTGGSPTTALVQHSDGSFYGTTSGAVGLDKGSIFRVTSAGTITTLVTFRYIVEGTYPNAALVRGNDGNFYGMTQIGGSGGNGTAFRMTPGGALTTLVNFADNHGRESSAGLIQGRDGNFYGTTSASGRDGGYGTVFRMPPSGGLTTLVRFNRSNGDGPKASLVEGRDGNFYGTTDEGGAHDGGTVFRMTPSGELTTLVNFYYDFEHPENRGTNPRAALIQGRDGNFYGTTYYGGSHGYGTVFRMTPSGELTTLVNFTNSNRGDFFAPHDGGNPSSALLEGSDGNFYGTTELGSVFRMTASGALTILGNFQGGFYGGTSGSPQAPLIQGADGYLYGTTYHGGEYENYPHAGGGTVFRLSPTGGNIVIVAMFSGGNGRRPKGPLVPGSDGNFYGTTSEGGTSDRGTVFRMTPDGVLTTLVNFSGPNGAAPAAALLLAADGSLYGITSEGGTDPDGQLAGGGQIFRLRFGPPPTAISMNPDGTPAVTSKGAPGADHEIQRSTDLREWVPMGTVRAGAFGDISFTDPAPPAGQGFYRITGP